MVNRTTLSSFQAQILIDGQSHTYVAFLCFLSFLQRPIPTVLDQSITPGWHITIESFFKMISHCMLSMKGHTMPLKMPELDPGHAGLCVCMHCFYGQYACISGIHDVQVHVTQ